MASLTSKDFTRLLMYGTPEQHQSEAFTATGTSLEKQFATAGSSIRNSYRVEFRNYIDYIRATRGLDAAFARLEELSTTGLAPELHATAGMVAARRANDYRAAANHLAKAHAAWPTNTTILEYLAESWISVGALQEAASLLAEIQPATEREAIRFAELAALTFRWDIVDRMIGPWSGEEGEFRVRVLRERVALSSGFKGQSEDIPAYILNMPSDERKLALAVTLHAQLGVNAAKHPGVNAALLSPAERVAAAGHSRLKIGLGALGCALGHFSMWQQSLESSAAFSLMLEDDGLPYVQRDVASLVEEAGDFDVLFVNNRMSALKGGRLKHGVVSVWEALANRPESGGWGTDGYILSHQGAEKLLHAVEVDRVLGHIDGQLACYGIDPTADVVSNAQRIGRSIHSKSVSQTLLTVKCSEFPLVGSVDFGDSTIGRMGGHLN